MLDPRSNEYRYQSIVRGLESMGYDVIRNGVVLLVGKGEHVCLINMGKAPITHKRLKVFDI